MSDTLHHVPLSGKSPSEILETVIEDTSKFESPSVLPLPLPIPPLPPIPNPNADAPKRFQHFSDIDLAAIRIALGAPLTLPPLFSGESNAASRSSPTQLSSFWNYAWPPHNVPDGLYKRTLTSRHKSQFMYHLTAILYNTCVIIQLILGAVVTALSSTSSSGNASAKSTAITVLAAANTVNAGIVALLHNSGLPNRLRNDWNEYEKVEMHLLELCMTGVVPEGTTREEAIDAAFRKYGVAKETVRGNQPAAYAAITQSKMVPGTRT